MRIGKELEGFSGQACLVEHDKRHFVVSSTVAMFSGPETLVFPADEDGEVVSWGEVAGGRGLSRSEAMDDLKEAAFCSEHPNQRVNDWEEDSCWECDSA